MASALASAETPASHGHSFSKKTFHKPTYCHSCTDMLWGLIQQGYICEGKRGDHTAARTTSSTCDRERRREGGRNPTVAFLDASSRGIAYVSLDRRLVRAGVCAKSSTRRARRVHEKVLREIYVPASVFTRMSLHELAKLLRPIVYRVSVCPRDLALRNNKKRVHEKRKMSITHRRGRARSLKFQASAPDKTRTRTHRRSIVERPRSVTGR